MDLQIKGKKAIMAGGSAGMGRATAERLAEAGAELVITARREERLVKAAEEIGAIVTCEEHTVFGGLGSAVAEVVVESHPVPMKMLGVPGIFAPTGSANFLLDEFGMSPEGISESAVELLNKKE